MLRDRSGNTLRTARKLALDSNTRIVRDFAGTGDRNDLYRFTLSNRSRFDLKLTNLERGANIDVQLFSFKRARQAVLRSIGRIDFSQLPTRLLRRNLLRVTSSHRRGRKDESINFTLEPGQYQVRVVQRRGHSRYSMSLSATPTLEAAIGSASDTNSHLSGTLFNRSTSSNTTSSSTVVTSPSSGSVFSHGTLVSTPPSGTSSGNTTPSPSIATNPISSNSTSGTNIPTLLTQNWLRQFGTIGNDYAYGVAVNSHALYVSGSIPATDPSKTEAYVNRYTPNGSSLPFTNPSGSGNLRLLKEIATAAQSAVASDVAVDAAGNFYVVGVKNLSNSTSDGFVAKYASSGQLLWQKTIASTISGISAGDALSSVAVDAQGNVYVTGFTDLLPITGGNPGQAIVIKYNASGQQLWRKKYGGSQTDVASGVAVDSIGNVYITGTTNATLNGEMSLAGGTTFLAKFSGSNGTQLWSRQLGNAATPVENHARGIAIDSTDNLYITGDTQGLLAAGQPYAGETDGYLAKYTSSGTQAWIKQFGTTSLDQSQNIAVDAIGRIYLTGETKGSLFGNTPLGGSDAWLAEFDGSGNLTRSRLIGTALDDEAYGIAVSPLDPVSNTYQIYVAGQTRGTLEGSHLGHYDSWIGQYF